MISIYTGKPGAGKSYAALLAVVEELRYGDRDVVTNLAIRLDELNAYFQELGRDFVDVFSRVRLVERDDCKEFWRFRGRFTVLPGQDCVTHLGSLVNGQPGVLYVIDEAHLLFDARSWQKSADALTFYNSQHRKLRDELIFVTQFLKLIEVRVRGFAEMFHVYRNFGGVRMWSILHMPKRMRELVYSVEPGPAGIEPDSEAWRRLDPKVAVCYDTTAGVGMAGGRVAETRGKRGFALPWWWVVVALVVLAVCVKFASSWAAGKVASSFAKVGAQYAPAPPGAKPAVIDEKAPVSSMPPARQMASTSTDGAVVGPPVVMTGNAVRGRDVAVYLSDGRVLRRGDVLILTEDKVVTRTGQTYWKVRTSAKPPVGNQRQKPAS